MATTGHEDTQLLHDRGGSIVFILAPLATGGRGLWAYHEPGDDMAAISGPIRYPNATDLVQFSVDRRTLAFAITEGGALLYTNLSDLTERDTWQMGAASDAIGANYLPAASAPTPVAGIPYVGITETAGANAFLQNLEGTSLAMANPWAEWSGSGLPTPTQFFNNASVAIMEFTTEDFGAPDVIKEFLNVRLEFARNTRAYVGVFAESEGKRYGRWRGTVYPREEKLSGLKLLGRRLVLRVLIVYFNDQPLLLRAVSVDFNSAVAN
jgi:hypothetical protein